MKILDIIKMEKNVIDNNNEINMIVYQIPNSDDIIIGKTINGDWLVKTIHGIVNYTTNEIEEIYILSLSDSNMEKLTWVS